MTKISSALCAALALSFTVGTAAPLAAAPTFQHNAPAVSSHVVDVQNRRERRDRFERRGNTYYYNGERGYRYKRPGYRQHNGFWFPATAFIAGAIIGGAMSNNNGGGGSHVSWCSNRWRSYRAYDNSYQPNYGPRRVCVSPYG